MSATWGNKFKITVFGESHGNAIGVVIDGLPAGFKIDMTALNSQMLRRAPGRDKTATTRVEADTPQILSGMLNGNTTGAPLCAIIGNTNTKSQDYSNLMLCPRPAHSDYTANVKFNGFNDVRGGGNFSGRLTAPIVFAGSIARQILEQMGVVISAHISSIKGIEDKCFDTVNADLQLMQELSQSNFPLIDRNLESKMRDVIEVARLDGDSVGGTVECMVSGINAGLGSPMFDGVEGVISSIIFSIPAVKGIEFGAGFELADMYGSQSNDEFNISNGKIVTDTNNCGGILGGITNGMPIVFNTVIKPTPSISKTQQTVNLQTMQVEQIRINGRHDPCIVPRAVPVVEAATAIAIMNIL